MIYVIIGRREQGKTTLAAHMASRVERAAIFDPRGIIGPDVSRVREQTELGLAWQALFEGEIRQVSYTPDDELSEAWPLWGRCVAGWLKRDAHRSLAVVVDEVAFVPLEMSPAFEWVCRTSPRDRMHIFLTAHRPRDIHTSIRAITDHWILFPTKQEHDLKVIDEHCSPDVADAVQRLAPREWVHWDDGLSVASVHRAPADWYLDLSAPLPEAREARDTLSSGQNLANRRSLPLFS